MALLRSGALFLGDGLPELAAGEELPRRHVRIGPRGGGGGVRRGLRGDGIDGVGHGRGRIRGTFAARLALGFSQPLGLPWVCLGVDRTLEEGERLRWKFSYSLWIFIVVVVDFFNVSLFILFKIILLYKIISYIFIFMINQTIIKYMLIVFNKMKSNIAQKVNGINN
jgi:hypothetical protein